MPEVIVIGAGISGLTVAHKLTTLGKDVLVLESNDKAGGKIATERVEGYLLEAGPNSLRIENQETVDLIEELGLTDHTIEANASSKKRFILKKGGWVKTPGGPSEAIATSLLSLKGKFRMAFEPFISKTKLEDESIASFVTRRFGREIFEHAADPFISGIYAGDPQKLSMRYAFPKLWEAEQNAGSIIGGMMKGRKGQPRNRIKPRVVSFREGFSEFTDAISIRLGERIQLSTAVNSIEKTQTGFDLNTSSGTFNAKTIIIATPAYHAASMIESFAPDLSRSLHTVEYPAVAVAYLGYRIDQFANIPEGFGGLIPFNERRRILGIIFSSSLFPDRAPEGEHLFTVLMGGARDGEISSRSNDEILISVTDEVGNLLKPHGNPVFSRVKVWERAIPQYNMGYGSVLNAIESSERNNTGLHFMANYRGGISVGACIHNATELAKSLV